jgi:hypothetical protein
MSASCPPPPGTPAHLKVTLRKLAAGTQLVRFHSPDYHVLGFNPNLDKTGAPKLMAIKSHGSRFNPFPNSAGINVSTLYAGTTDHAAALESVFHDVPHVPDPPFAVSKLADFVLSRFETKQPLHLLDLLNSGLHQVQVASRTHSLEEGQLIHSNPTNYPITRQWAQHFFLSLPTLQGLAWRPRLGGEGTSYVFFGDRLSISSDLQPLGKPVRIDIGTGLDLMKRIAKDAHIDLGGKGP